MPGATSGRRTAPRDVPGRTGSGQRRAEGQEMRPDRHHGVERPPVRRRRGQSAPREQQRRPEQRPTTITGMYADGVSTSCRASAGRSGPASVRCRAIPGRAGRPARTAGAARHATASRGDEARPTPARDASGGKRTAQAEVRERQERREEGRQVDARCAQAEERDARGDGCADTPVMMVRRPNSRRSGSHHAASICTCVRSASKRSGAKP